MPRQKGETIANAEQAMENPAVTIQKDIYPVSDLVAASREVFRVPQECAVAALAPLKKKKMTVSEARAAINKFMTKEVK